jgi:hypothetical protein
MKHPPFMHPRLALRNGILDVARGGLPTEAWKLLQHDYIDDDVQNMYFPQYQYN